MVNDKANETDEPKANKIAEEDKQRVYLHKGQMDYLIVNAHTSIMICSRRWGKSYIAALTVMRNITEMPRSVGAYVAQSFRQAHTRTLPSLFFALEQFGLKRDIHYVVGKKPSAFLGYPEPYIMPNDWSDVISFYTGAIMVVISQDVKLSSNSMTIDWLIGDEAKGLNYEKLKDEVLPANGGTTRFFGDCPWHHSILFCSDMPASKSGFWLFNYKDQCDEELVQAIRDLVAEQKYLLANPDIPRQDQRLSLVRRRLAALRSKCVYYRECSIFDNIDVVGVNYVEQMKRDLTPLVFQTSILCQRIKNIQGGFYTSFNPKIHTYSANNNTEIKLGTPIARWDCAMDTDIDPQEPIAVAFDYNMNIDWICCGQISGRRLKVLSSMFVKYNEKLRELVDKFCEYYAPHPTKHVVYYYDSTALGSNYAASLHDFQYIVQEQFFKNNWRVTSINVGNPMKHGEKYRLINDCFKGVETSEFENHQCLLPILNKDNNTELIETLQLTGLTIGSKGLQKDKSGEKRQENENDRATRLEARTDSTDAFDTLLIGCCLFPYTESLGYSF